MIDWDSEHILRTCKKSAETLSARDWAANWASLAAKRHIPCEFEGELTTWTWWFNDLEPHFDNVMVQLVLEDAERRTEPGEGCNSCTPHYNVVVDTVWRLLEERPLPAEEHRLAELWAVMHVEAGLWTWEKMKEYMSYYPEEEPLSLGLEEEEQVPLSLW